MKKIFLLLIIMFTVGTAIWGKNYYNNRYVQSDSYYTRIPLDEKNDKTEWILDDQGKKMDKGKEYNLKGYNKDGKERKVSFYKFGTSKDYYPAGTYLKIGVSKTITLNQKVVKQDKIPVKALNKLK